MLDEMQVQLTGGQVRAAHVGLARQGRVWGTISFGYRAVPIEGAPPSRHGKVPKTWQIDEAEAKWVRQIFAWYVELELSRESLARRLNAEGAPLPPQSQLKQWTKQAVHTVLTNLLLRGRLQLRPH